MTIPTPRAPTGAGPRPSTDQAARQVAAAADQRRSRFTVILTPPSSLLDVEPSRSSGAENGRCRPGTACVQSAVAVATTPSGGPTVPVGQPVESGTSTKTLF